MECLRKRGEKFLTLPVTYLILLIGEGGGESGEHSVLECLYLLKLLLSLLRDVLAKLGALP